MKIESHLPQFTYERALLVVAAEKCSKLYLAEAGQLEEIEQLAQPKEKYSDREGFFTKGSKTMSYGTGAVYEIPKQYLQSRFLHSLKTEVHRINEELYFNALYLFAPSYMAKLFREAIGKEFENRIRMVIHGNLIKAHPFRLLELIRDEEAAMNARRNFYSSEVRRLLNSVEARK